MLKEEYLQQLMKSIYDKDGTNVYDHSAAIFTTQSDEFGCIKSWADQLVRDKLATYTDAEHTILQLTNFGKYWMMNGGYLSFLKENESTKDHHKEEHKQKEEHKELEEFKIKAIHKEELLEARLKLIHYRLWGFWLTLVISCMGFFLSLYNLYLIMNGRK